MDWQGVSWLEREKTGLGREASDGGARGGYPGWVIVSMWGRGDLYFSLVLVHCHVNSGAPWSY